MAALKVTPQSVLRKDRQLAGDLNLLGRIGSSTELRSWLRSSTTLPARVRKLVRVRATGVTGLEPWCERCGRHPIWPRDVQSPAGAVFALIDESLPWTLGNIHLSCRACAGLWPSATSDGDE